MPLSSLKLPDALARRHLLEGNLDSDKALALARTYLDAGREVEAIDFLAAAKTAADGGSDSDAHKVLVELSEEALARGDAFLMRIVIRALGTEPSAQTWQALADAATEAGRPRDAETAQRLATVGQ